MTAERDSRSTTAPESSPKPARLVSLDALRGFDMFWIIGGSGLFVAAAETTDLAFFDALARQFEHVEWNGFRFWDLIFPLFIFVAGVAMPFSLTRRAERGDDRAALRRHVVFRGVALVVLGVVYNGLLEFDFAELRCASVLGRIGLSTMFAGLIVLAVSVRGQIVCAVSILVAYCLALAVVPVPEFGAGNLEPGATLTDWVDRMLLPGKLYRGDRDPEGLLSTVPAISTALLGALAGHWLRRGLDRGVRHDSPDGTRKALGLAGAGFGCLGAGLLWGLWFPINKNLWTSSFVLYAGGWSLLLLALFYYVIDVRGYRRWAFVFVVIGMNAIAAYLLRRFVDFDGIAGITFARAVGRVHPAILAGGGVFLEWLVLYVLYRRRVFLRL